MLVSDRLFQGTVDEILQAFGPVKVESTYRRRKDKAACCSTTPLAETPRPVEPIQEQNGIEDEAQDKHTPERVDATESEGDETGKTISAKGRSVLRPSRNEIPIEPLSPASRRLGLYQRSPIETRLNLKRKNQAKDSSQLRRQKLVPSPDPPCSEAVAHKPSVGRVSKASTPAARSPSPQPLTISETSSEPSENDWHCTLDVPRCNYIVTNVKTAEGKSEVKLHYESHGRIMAAAMQTIDLEMQRYGGARGGYHVENLMEKIQYMSQKWLEGKPTPLEDVKVPAHSANAVKIV
jgi:hypothetical protein